MRESFIGKECYKILRMKSQASDLKTKLEKQTLKASIIKECLLAQHLKDLFESFFYRKTVTLKINRWVQLSINQVATYGHNHSSPPF
jgi:hypothetical protein